MAAKRILHVGYEVDDVESLLARLLPFVDELTLDRVFGPPYFVVHFHRDSQQHYLANWYEHAEQKRTCVIRSIRASVSNKKQHTLVAEVMMDGKLFYMVLANDSNMCPLEVKRNANAGNFGEPTVCGESGIVASLRKKITFAAK